MNIEDKIRISQLCALAAMADREFAPSEARSLETLMNHYKLTPEQKERALSVNQFTDATELVRALDEEVSKREVARQIASVIRADDRIEESELDLMEEVMLAFGLDSQRVSEARSTHLN